MTLSSPDSTSRPRSKWLVIVALATIIAAVAIPQYISGQWPWQSPPEVAQIRAVRDLKETGLTIPGWTENRQQKVPIGGDEWSVQQLTQTEGSEPQQMVLFLKPQGRSKDQPEVEWIDLQGTQKWQTSNHRRRRVGTLTMETFQARTSNQTFAITQWYAMPHGGHPAPHQWFWHDQQYQWTRGERLPWVAVSILLPMPALGDISTLYPDLDNLSQLVQASLKDTAFTPTP